MNKKYIILGCILSILILPMSSCKKIVSSNERKDIEMNIIDNENNIETILLGTKNKMLKVEDIVEQNTENALVVGGLGQIDYIDEDGYFKVADNFINYMDKMNELKVKDVKGIMINPPDASITDSYNHMDKYLKEKDVLFILLDGFGYHQYKYAIENKYLPFLEKQGKAIKALSVYKPVTNAGLAAIITGVLPYKNGVHSRKDRELKVDSIFKLVKNVEKKAIYIEGNIGILKTEIEPVLNLDNNGDGFTDDEVFKSTLNAMGENYDLVFTHFHGIDDSGHTHGDLSLETMKVIERIDTYIEKLASKWRGKIIITSDHGMHSTKNGGNHGEFRYEDMVVPYITISGRSQFE